MELNYAKVQYKVLSRLSRALELIAKKENHITEPVTVEIEGLVLHIVHGQRSIGGFKFESQEGFEAFLDNGYDCGRRLRTLLLSYNPEKKYRFSPLYQKVDKMADKLRELLQEKREQEQKQQQEQQQKSYQQRQGQSQWQGGGQRQQSSQRPPKDVQDFIRVKIELSNLFGIKTNAPNDDYKREHRRFMQQNHPDKNPHSDQELVKRINALMTQFNELRRKLKV